MEDSTNRRRVFTNSQVRLDCYKMSDVSDVSNPFESTQMRAMSRGPTFSTIQYGSQSNQKHKNGPWCTCLAINFWFGKCPKSWIQITFAMTKAVNFQIFVGHDFNGYIFLLILNVCWLNYILLLVVLTIFEYEIKGPLVTGARKYGMAGPLAKHNPYPHLIGKIWTWVNMECGHLHGKSFSHTPTPNFSSI
jgi:hypothetical protein